jgi:hypothetical protein
MMSDHGWLDQPYLNQFVDYSPAMSSYYVGYLKKKYGSLSKLAAAYGRRYDRWEAIEPPLPRFEKDDSGRLKPATSPVWHDWMDARTHAMWDNKYAMLSGLRQGDPASQIGFYADDTLPYNLSNYVRYGVFVPQGSIEMMFPPGRYSCPVRYEPIGKIARTAQLTDVGMTNILAQCPGRDSFNNFVFPESRVSTLGPTEAEAETRLVQWFSVIDRLYGAKQIEDANGGANPAYLYSIESLFSINQHAFDGRVEDPIKPYKFQVGAEKLHVDWLNADSLGDTDLAARPYYYVPFCADVLTPKTIDALLARVKAGARLVLEPTSGYWLDGSPASNAIGNRLGILPIVPYDTPSTVPDSVETTVKADALGKANLSFRVRGWNPPVETQPVPWLQNVPPAYLRPYRLSAIPANAALLASYPDNSPAAFTMPYGKGDILVFCGVVDWLSCEGLASAVDAWGRKKPWSGALAGDPTLITSAYINNGATYVVGRRFIGHDDIGKLAGGIRPPNTRVAETRNCVMPANGDGSYQVRDLVNGTDFGVLSGASLRARGVDLSLLPGQGFLLEAQPVIATATGK